MTGPSSTPSVTPAASSTPSVAGYETGDTSDFDAHDFDPGDFAA